jgi:hypothetical protein
MNKSRIISLCLGGLLVVAAALAAPAVVWVRGVDGKWKQTKADKQGGKVTVKIGAAEVGSGQLSVVVDKPDWMVLDDELPPQVVWLRVNEREIKPAAEGDLGVVSGGELKLAWGLKDTANPMNAASVQVTLEPRPAGLKVETKELGFPKASGRLTVTLPNLEAGVYRGSVRVADLSPQRNVLEIPLRFSVIGISVSEDKQRVRVATPGGEFVLQGKRLADLQIGSGPVAYLTNNVAGEHMYLEQITEVEVVKGEGGLVTAKVKGVPGKTDKDKDGSTMARLEYELTVRPDLPGVLVNSRTVNLSPKTGLYCWWGWLPGKQFHTPEGAKEWSGQYKGVGKVGWVFLEPMKEDQPGIGWISPLVFGESRFSTMLLYTDPQKMERDTGEASELRFVLLNADQPEEVAAVAKKVAELGLW